MLKNPHTKKFPKIICSEILSKPELNTKAKHILLRFSVVNTQTFSFHTNKQTWVFNKQWMLYQSFQLTKGGMDTQSVIHRRVGGGQNNKKGLNKQTLKGGGDIHS